MVTTLSVFSTLTAPYPDAPNAGTEKPMVPTTTAATAAVANLDFFIHTSLSMSGIFGCPLARKA